MQIATAKGCAHWHISGVVVVLLLTAACTSTGEPNRQLIGGVLGGTVGAIAGAQFGSGSGQLATTALGAFLGAYFSSEIGQHLDEEDRQRAESTFHTAAASPSGQTHLWNNPDSGNSGAVTMTGPAKSYDDNCRKFTQTVTVDSESQESTGIACRQDDGSWQVLNI
jgi:surface antigen